MWKVQSLWAREGIYEQSTSLGFGAFSASVRVAGASGAGADGADGAGQVRVPSGAGASESCQVMNCDKRITREMLAELLSWPRPVQFIG